MDPLTCQDLRVELLSGTGPDGQPTLPTEVRLFKAGENRTSKGVFKFTATSAKSVIDAWTEQGNPMNFDWDHAMLKGGSDPAEAGKAAGWFEPEIRQGELWATKVEWTPLAQQKIRHKEFRFLSPAFAHTKDREVLELVNVALTNIPATKAMQPLMANKEQSMDPVTLALLGLKPEATPVEITATITALKANSDQVTALQAEIAELRKAKEQGEVDALVKAGKEEGKIAPAMEDWAKAQSAAALKAYLAVAVKIVTPAAAATTTVAPEKKPEPTTTVTLSKEELAMAKALGQSAKDMLARKIERAGQDPVAEDDE